MEGAEGEDATVFKYKVMMLGKPIKSTNQYKVISKKKRASFNPIMEILRTVQTLEISNPSTFSPEKNLKKGVLCEGGA